MVKTQYADVLETEVINGEVRVKIGDTIRGAGFISGVSMYGPDGFLGRPNPPSGDGACQVVYLIDGTGRLVIGCRDNRFVEKVGALEPGDRAIVTDGDARFFIKQVNDSVVLYTLNQPENKSMLVELNGKNGTLTLMNGGAWIEMKEGGITLGAAGGTTVVAINEDGVHIQGNKFHCATSKGQLGFIETPLVPIPEAMGVAYGTVGPNNTISTSWTVAK